MFFASATMMFQFYAQGWFITGLTDSVALLGVLGVARGTGMLLFSTLAVLSTSQESFSREIRRRSVSGRMVAPTSSVFA